MPASRPEGPARPLLALAAAGVLCLLWNLPVRPGSFSFAHFAAVPVEVLALVGLLAVFPSLRHGPHARRLALAAAALTLLATALMAADLGIRTALARPFNFWLDLNLAPALVHLLTGTIGGTLGWLALAGVLVVLAGIGGIAFLAVRALQRALDAPGVRRGAIVAAVVMLVATALAPRDAADPYRPLTVHTSANLIEQWERGRELLAALPEFRREAARDRFRDAGGPGFLAGLDGADVLLMYVESYGRSALEDPRYAKTLRPRLAAFAAKLAGADLGAVSGWLTSPTAGGQSWLAHGTLESGLWLPHQRYYDLLLTTERLTLTEAFNRAGYRTVALKPAITMPWPEGRRFGFDRIYAAADMGYRGKPYNWVTMPDQYTLAVLEARERRTGDRPLFAEISLISSHAPWTPIPPVLDDWSRIGDGRIFSRWADLGDPPAVLWRDVERVRAHYALALDYVLGVLASYAERFVDDDTLLVIVGDHQAAPLITGEGAGRDVPMHVISGDPDLLAPFRDWGFAAGMTPDPAGPVRRMDAFRDWFLGAFSDDDPGAVAAR